MIWLFMFHCSSTPDVQPIKEQSIQKKPNVVLVLIDTLRTDHVTPEIAPNLMVMANRSRQFTNTWSTSSWTAPSSASVATGLLPIEHSIYKGFVASAQEGSQKVLLNTLPKDIPTLAEKLKTAGYNTYGLASNINIDSAIGFDRGFDQFQCTPEEDAHILFGKIDEWNLQEPYFLYLHLNDVHSPYEPRAPWYKKQESKHEDMIAAYDSEISYIDNELAKLYQKMSWEKNVLLITSDHGEEFMDHGQYGHLDSLYRELTDVIFWLSGPGISPQVVDTPLSLADTHHILLYALGLAPKHSKTPVVSQRVGPDSEIWSITDKEWRWVNGELYKTSDTKELQNLSSEYPDIAEKYKLKLEGIQKAKGRRSSIFHEHDLPQNDVHLLKKLGYVE